MSQEFPLTFRSKTSENFYRFHEDGRYEIISRIKTRTGPLVKNPVEGYAASSFTFGKFQDYPTETKQAYMMEIAKRHVMISEGEFHQASLEIFEQGYRDFHSTLMAVQETEIEPGDSKTITLTDNTEIEKFETLEELSYSESEVDQVVREMRDENFKNGF